MRWRGPSELHEIKWCATVQWTDGLPPHLRLHSAYKAKMATEAANAFTSHNDKNEIDENYSGLKSTMDSWQN